MRRRDLTAALAGAAVTVVLAGSVALAAIPGDGGVIQGCYLKIGGVLRVVDTAKNQKCHSSLEIPISWNQKGQPGETGAAGPVGPSGPKGDPGDPGAGIARLEDLDGLPCSTTFDGRVSVTLVAESIRSSAITLKCLNVGVRTLNLTVIRASDIASQISILAGRVRIEPWATNDIASGTCIFEGPQCSWDSDRPNEELTAHAIADNQQTVFKEWQTGPCAGSTAPTCSFTLGDNVAIVAVFKSALG